ncbi:hypothetical protein B0H63DRAFT_283424 [Podospora didyma]|uniref:RRM domain-containing protein n=1 Tax=Podospora didyma TaxID=330526 RepID=A0AAE0N6D2_9PEZI|nr:hypothetical protein B0H63DRAFT_283424 [Podospora didyma]
MNGDHSPPAAGATTASSSFVPTSSSSSTRASPFPPATGAMAAPAFVSAQSFRLPASSQSTLTLAAAAAKSFEPREATKPLPNPYPATSAPQSAARIRCLPLNTSEESLRLMVVFSKDLASVEVLPVEQSPDHGFRSAILKFKTPSGAHEVKNMLDGKSNISNDAKMVVEVMSSSPTGFGNRFTADMVPGTGTSTGASSATSSTNSSRQASRFNGSFQSLDRISPPLGNGVFTSADLTSSEPGGLYHGVFSPQSPIGNHLDRTRVSGKSIINEGDDDETGELLKDPVGFAENGLQRRQTAPHISLSRMASLSLNTTPTTAAAPMSHYGHPGMVGLSHVNAMSPSNVTAMAYGQQQQASYRGHGNFPPANPADQNPPCNTLYVGNLPIDTSEEELKAMFSRQRGYKRLCFRTKPNGPMCFVEFEDVSFATKALNDLYGQPLHNSIKGGIRLSFSKNPLGVRSGPSSVQTIASPMSVMNGVHSGSGNGFTTAHGPPPGLSAPPGLGMNRSAWSRSPSLATGGSNVHGGR